MPAQKVLEVKLLSLSEGDGIPERRILLAAGQDVIVGRASSNRGVAASADNTKINNPVISKEHAAITTDPTGTTVFIRDLKSMHGTRVDGRELSQGEEFAISSGSTLQFGSPVIRGNATYEPASYTFYANPVTATGAFSSAFPTTTTVPQSQEFSDAKKGYGDDSSLYSEDDYDMEEEEDDMHENGGDTTMIPDTYFSEQDSDASPDGSAESSSEDSGDDSEGSDDMSVECYPKYSVQFATDASVEISSTAAVADESSFSSSYVEGSEVLGEHTSSDQPSSASAGVNLEMLDVVWEDAQLGDPANESNLNPWMSEAAGNIMFKTETEEPEASTSPRPWESSLNKTRPFSNSINDLCEPIPEADASFPATQSGNHDMDAAVGEIAAGATSDVEMMPSAGEQKAAHDDKRPIDEAATAVKLNISKVEATRPKRSAVEAKLDAEDVPSVDDTNAAQAATPEQMSKRRIANFTRRARDFSIGAVVGGVTIFTVLASIDL